jgi:AhpD family alkylhydroperoxidase
MEYLSLKEKELVAIGAALASNCIPSVEYHIPMAIKAGLTDNQIKEAIEIANKVRNVPSAKVLEVALNLISPEEKQCNGGMKS